MGLVIGRNNLEAHKKSVHLKKVYRLIGINRQKCERKWHADSLSAFKSCFFNLRQRSWKRRFYKSNFSIWGQFLIFSKTVIAPCISWQINFSIWGRFLILISKRVIAPCISWQFHLCILHELILNFSYSNLESLCLLTAQWVSTKKPTFP